MRKTILFFILILSFAVAPVFATTDVDIDIDTTNNMDIDITTNANNLNATILLNGKDILEEKREIHSAFEAYLISGWWSQEALEKIEELEGRHEALIEELNLVLNDMSIQIGITYQIIGVDHNSSDVVELLRSGNASVADILQESVNDIDAIELELDEVENEIIILVQELEASNEEAIGQLIIDFNQYAEDTEDSTEAMFLSQGTKILMLEMTVENLVERYNIYTENTTNLLILLFGFNMVCVIVVAVMKPRSVAVRAK